MVRNPLFPVPVGGESEGKVKRSFDELLPEVQAYLTEKYSALLTDSSGDKREQLISHIKKYISDRDYAVDGLSRDNLMSKLYDEMVEFSFLTKYLKMNTVEEVNSATRS